MDIDIDAVNEIRNPNLLMKMILSFLEKNGSTSKSDLFQTIENQVREKFPNLRSDYFDLHYKKSSGVFTTILYFALVWLKENHYGMIEQKGKKNDSYFSLSFMGKKFLTTPTVRQEFISIKEIEQFVQKEYPEFWKKSLSNPINKKKKQNNDKQAQETEQPIQNEEYKDINDQEVIDEIQDEKMNWETMSADHISAKGQTILDKMYKLEPARNLEVLVGDLLETMGYGRASYTCTTGDGGIDIIINKDILGLDKALVQVKRYNQQQKIGASEIRSFIGALQVRKMRNGIFVTTSDFTREAIKTAEQHNIVTVNGKRLTELMIEHGMGIKEVKKYTLYELDEEFFMEYKNRELFFKKDLL